MSSGVAFRDYVDDDWEAVCLVHDRSRPDELIGSCDARAFVPLAKDPSAANIHRCRKRVACDGDRVVGFVGVEDTYVAWLYVDPDYYGRGIGRDLLRFAMREAGPNASTTVLEGNRPARHLYESEGFIVRKRFAGDNAGYPCWCLSMELEPSRRTE